MIFFVLLLSVISITGFISDTKNICYVTPERVTLINRFFIYNYILDYQICNDVC